MASKILDPEFFNELLKQVDTYTDKRIIEEVDRAVDYYRHRVWTRAEWCCKNMRGFAKAVWDMPNPPKTNENEFGGTALLIRGYHVNYCPFCGVKVD